MQSNLFDFCSILTIKVMIEYNYKNIKKLLLIITKKKFNFLNFLFDL